METIGVRELRQHASRYLRLVEEGRTIEVTTHGRSVALLVPARLDLVKLDDELLEAAAALDGGILRSLDAIHLAAAQTFSGDLTAIVTYDDRMTAAAERLGLPVAAPG